MSALAARVPAHDLAEDPRNAVIAAFTSMLETAIDFAKSHDCDAQIRQIVKRLLPDLAPPADLFGKPIANGKPLPDLFARACAADDTLSDLFLTMVSKAPSRLTNRRLTAAEHKAHETLAEMANIVLALRREAQP